MNHQYKKFNTKIEHKVVKSESFLFYLSKIYSLVLICMNFHRLKKEMFLLKLFLWFMSRRSNSVFHLDVLNTCR